MSSKQIVTKAEALRKIAELEKQVQEWKEHILGTVVANKERKIAELEAQVKQSQESPFLKALADVVDEVVTRRLDAMGGAAPGPGVTLEKGQMYVALVKAAPDNVKFSDKDLEGKVLSVMYESSDKKKFEAFEIAAPINARWGADVDGPAVSLVLQGLFEKKVLGKVIQGKHTRYFVPEGVTLVPVK